MNKNDSFLKIKSYIDYAVSTVTHSKFNSLDQLQKHISLWKKVYWVVWIISAFVVGWLAVISTTHFSPNYPPEMILIISFVVGVSIQLITHEFKKFGDRLLDQKLEKVLYHKVSLNGIENDYKALTNYSNAPPTITVMQLNKILRNYAYSYTLR